MPNHLQDRKSTLISEEAAEWLVILKESNLRFSERRRYVRWLKQSPAHIADILRLSALNGLLRKADLEGIRPGPEEADRKQESNVIDLALRQVSATATEIIQHPLTLSHWK